ncbi:chaperone NapD [Pseudoxanthomonas sp. PXM01]|uniref:chaperone NapD n=1 Tax=Pseudoxanthomonas sp. PXM01 TaxID=2769295 RepID=UPI0017803B97|nr:chaperone NapD [Pseudoxanthomonas sp. PXM01]MBD9470416.1 chaperone NapD [Pseudoxanthomonas sp. PXM01]
MTRQRPDADVHIASFVIQHRDSAARALAAMIDAHDDLDLALRGETRSVVICESADRHAVMERVDQLQAVPGVLNVLLVYHHAEPAHALDEPLPSLSIVSATGDAHEHTP